MEDIVTGSLGKMRHRNEKFISAVCVSTSVKESLIKSLRNRESTVGKSSEGASQQKSPGRSGLGRCPPAPPLAAEALCGGGTRGGLHPLFSRRRPAAAPGKPGFPGEPLRALAPEADL